ncbi:NAD-dependent epimerase/dehydratase family protein [Castellaniella sp. MT123]|uniref:NAD-dependent epimerase/dehydratase family protein n=1 Tax=Castellaniella sp. MT123 TaxID=3140381 RepID=UPI0031F42679
MTRILVTGGSGFIGRTLCGHLQILGVDVVPVVRRVSGMPGEQIVARLGTALDAVLVGCDAVVHLAGDAQAPRGGTTADLEVFRSAQVGLACGWAQAAAAAGVRRFVFVSSAKVNGEWTADGQAFSSDDTPGPQDIYAQSKWDAEQALCRIATETGLELVIVRPPMVYGPGGRGNFAALVAAVCRGVPLPFGAVRNHRSMIAVTNLVDFLALCADPAASPGAAGRVFLVSDGQPVATPELLKRIAQAYGCKARLLPVPPAFMVTVARLLGRRQVADRLLGSLVLDDSLARDLLGWKPVVTMDEQLRVMANAAGV